MLRGFANEAIPNTIRQISGELLRGSPRRIAAITRSAEEAVDLVYERLVDVTWEKQGVVEFDAVRMSAIDADGEDIDGYTRGKG